MVLIWPGLTLIEPLSTCLRLYQLFGLNVIISFLLALLMTFRQILHPSPHLIIITHLIPSSLSHSLHRITFILRYLVSSCESFIYLIQSYLAHPISSIKFFLLNFIHTILLDVLHPISPTDCFFCIWSRPMNHSPSLSHLVLIRFPTSHLVHHTYHSSSHQVLLHLIPSTVPFLIQSQKLCFAYVIFYFM